MVLPNESYYSCVTFSQKTTQITQFRFKYKQLDKRAFCRTWRFFHDWDSPATAWTKGDGRINCVKLNKLSAAQMLRFKYFSL